MSVSQEHLHAIQNDPAGLKIAAGVTLTDLQRKHTAVVLDLFQGKGTRAKILDFFTEDAAYEDPFASCVDRNELAGQLLGIPNVSKSSTTEFYEVISAKPVQATGGSGNAYPDATEISLRLKQDIALKPIGHYRLDSVVLIYSTNEGIVRFQDRPTEEIPDNSLIKALRRLNGVAVPPITVPADEKADAEKAAAHGI